MNEIVDGNLLNFEEYLLANLLNLWTHPSPIHRIARFITSGIFFTKKCSPKYVQCIQAASQLLLLGESQSS